MVYDDSNFGIYGTSLYGGSGFGEFILGNVNFGLLGQSQLGTTSKIFTLVWSGCYF